MKVYLGWHVQLVVLEPTVFFYTYCLLELETAQRSSERDSEVSKPDRTKGSTQPMLAEAHRNSCKKLKVLCRNVSSQSILKLPHKKKKTTKISLHINAWRLISLSEKGGENWQFEAIYPGSDRTRRPPTPPLLFGTKVSQHWDDFHRPSPKSIG